MATLSQYSLMRPENAIALPSLRKWQERCVDQIREAVREGHKRIVVQSPTGAGKTLLSAHLFAGSIAKGKRPLFVVPDLSLIDQTVKAFKRVGIHDIGVIQGRHAMTDWQAQVQVASIQTLIRRPIPNVDLIVWDEAHVVFKGMLKLLESPEWSTKLVVGLSATPWARGMGLHWSKLIIGATIEELIADGVLCGFQGYGPSIDADLSKVKVKAGEYDEAQSAAVMSQPKIVADVVEQWIKHGGQDRTFMFCVNRAHAREQQAKFEAAGIPFGYIDGTMDPETERKPVFEAFRRREIKGIASVGCLSRGVDEDVQCVIDAAPTNSEMSYVQRIGRGLRNPTGEKTLLILDHAGNAERLGTVTDIFHDELDCHKPGDREKSFEKDKPKQARKCPQCNGIMPYGRAKCLMCGFVFKPQSETEHLPGDLKEFGSSTKKQPTKEEKQAFYSQALALGKERNHKPGWSAWLYRKKFGVWPRGLSDKHATPTPEFRSYEQSRRIAYAKSQETE